MITDKTSELSVRALVSDVPNYPMYPSRTIAGESVMEQVDGRVDFVEVQVIDGSLIMVKLERQGLYPAMARLSATEVSQAPQWLRDLVNELLPDGFTQLP